MKLGTLQRVALYIFFFSINFEVWDPFNTGGNFSVAKLTGLLYLLSLIPQFRYFFRVKNFKRVLTPLFIFFGLLTVISILNINYFSSDFFSFSIFQNIILLILLVNHAKKDPGILEKGFVAYALGSVALAFLFYLGIGIENDGGRISLFGDNENAIGIRMCISIIYLLFIVIQNPFKQSVKRYFFLIAIPIMLSILVATGSRVAIISLSLCFALGLILLKTRKILTKIFIFAIGLLLGYFLYNYILSSGVLYQRLINSAENRNWAGRDVIWKSIIPLISNNPVFGVGTTGYALYTNKIFGELTSPHNVVLEVLCYTGIVGFSIYLLFLFRIFKISFLNYRISGSLIQLLLLIPILGLLLSGQLLNVKIGWVIFAFVVGAAPLSRTLIKYRNK